MDPSIRSSSNQKSTIMVIIVKAISTCNSDKEANQKGKATIKPSCDSIRDAVMINLDGAVDATMVNRNQQ